MMKTFKRELPRNLPLVAFLFLGLVMAWLFYDAGQQRDAIKQEALIACLDNEKQNDLIRKEARERYDRLDETLKFLGIPKTPAIVRRAKLDRDTTLNRFRPVPCPRAHLE